MADSDEVIRCPDLDAFLECLQQVDPRVQGVLLQRMFRSLAGLELSEADSLRHWGAITIRHAHRQPGSDDRMSLRVAMLEHFYTEGLLRNPVFVESQNLERLQVEAATDGLTGLYNRRVFDAWCTRELSRARRHSETLTLVVIDLAAFKQLNDAHGHAVGDDVLRRLAQAMMDSIRESDFAFRIGGDEFAILLPHAGPLTAHSLAERMQSRLSDLLEVVSLDAGVRIDWGVASYPNDGDTPVPLFQVADQHLYERKRQLSNGSRPLQPPTPRQDSPLGQIARRHERVRLTETTAYVLLATAGKIAEACLIDISRGGVGFSVPQTTVVPSVFLARIQIANVQPPFSVPSEDIPMRRAYAVPIANGLSRVGCSFAHDLV